MTNQRTPSLPQKILAEGLGTALLLAAVVGSGIMGEHLAEGNLAVALLANSLATAGALIALITTFGGVSGAHFNPLVTLSEAYGGAMQWSDVPAYILAQAVGAFAGVAVANLMFQQPAFFISTHEYSGMAKLLSEFVATFGLLAVILGTARSRPEKIPTVVGLYIFTAIWFTSSSSFANPAMTLARMTSDTFTGIRPADVPGFIAAQVLGAAAAVLLFGRRKGV
ncbi:MAG: aquaporin family protein [Armatimonadetes bacterium]|nr:aquaporin family protein [Armatimonadota bacterium]